MPEVMAKTLFAYIFCKCMWHFI